MSRIAVVVTGGVLATLVVLGGLSLGAATLVGLGVFGALLGTTASALMFTTSTGEVPDDARAARNHGLAIGGGTVLGLVAMNGLGVLLGEALGPVLALLVVVAALVLGHRWVSTYGSGPPLPRAAELSSEALCRQWRRSYNLLREASDTLSAERIALTRQSYLDELERRDPAGFARWLAAEAGPDSDPARFVATGSDEDGGPMGLVGR